MSLFKCKMCGGTLEIKNETVAECEYCGTQQTLPKLNDERRANLYDRANHFRRNNEFDKAMGIYEQILNEDNTDSEAYWSLVLCRYGIEYVEDPATHKRVPTVNRAQFTSIFDDDNYKSALNYADSYQKAIYEAEARAINEIQKGILAISQKEEPFDVFICYKETDHSGRRTPDSVLANDLYHQLTQEGFKVFFSRITLEDKLGTAYEPYIFAALNSAKVMVVLGTKPEHFKAVWVRNEWSRYLSLIKGGAKKVLIPAYKDMDPYDLPEEFSHLQAQDMSKLGFMQDLIRGVRKILDVAPQQTAVVKETIIANGSTNTAPLLRRAFMFLEDGNWNSADEYCEKVLDIAPENAEAYLGKLMAELQVRKREDLHKYEKPFDSNSNYQKAIRFGNTQLADELKNCIACIEERIEEARKDAILAKARSTAHYDPEKSIQLLESINGWKDADDLTLACKKRLEEIQIEEKAEKKKSKKIATIAISVIFAFIAIIILLTTVVIPKSNYNKAVTLMENGDYVAAKNIFKTLGNYEDSTQKLEDCYIRIHGESLYRKLSSLELQGTVEFGTYEQDGDANTTNEPITWYVIKKSESGFLLLSERILFYAPFNNNYYDYTSNWKMASIYDLLNDSFYSSAFSTEEQTVIIENSDGTKVYLPSKEEVAGLPYKILDCYSTTYASRQSTDYRGCWALRTVIDLNSVQTKYKHYSRYYYLWVDEDGEIIGSERKPIEEFVSGVDGLYFGSSDKVGIRPAIWVSLDS